MTAASPCIWKVTRKTYKRNPGQERARRDLLTKPSRYCLIFGGSRSGKTFEFVGTIIERALMAPGSRHLIVRHEASSAKRAIAKGTLPDVVALRWPGLRIVWNDQYGFFKLPNGSEIWIGGLNDEKAMERILGNEYATIYMNEASEVKYSAFTLLRTRLAQTIDINIAGIEPKPLSQRFYIDLNPTVRQHWTYRLFIDGIEPEDQTPVDLSQYGHITINPMDNSENLSVEYLNELRNLPRRARKRFYDGQYGEDAEGALWRREMFQRVQKVPKLERIVVSVDPATTNTLGSDETGIIVAGVDAAGNGYVLEDGSGRHSPQDWARRAIAEYDLFEADRIVAETNQGGDMVEATIRSIREDVSYRGVHAWRAKSIRAEPIAALYERGKIYHVGSFDDLEDQLCAFTVGFDRKAAGYSPDRLDALVHAFTDLFGSLTAPRETEDDEYDDHHEAHDMGVTGY